MTSPDLARLLGSAPAAKRRRRSPMKTLSTVTIWVVCLYALTLIGLAVLR